MKSFNYTLKLSVSDNWIDDGFGSNKEELKEQIELAIREKLIPYADYTEFVIIVTEK